MKSIRSAHSSIPRVELEIVTSSPLVSLRPEDARGDGMQENNKAK